MIYGYIRVSTDKQDTENQKLGINDKAKMLGFEIQEWISDDGVSGAKEPDDRKLGKLLKAIKQDDVIIASELSRLGRKLFMVMRILEHCMNVNAKVYTVKDGYELGDNIQSKVLAFAFGLAAEIEREMIQMRTKEGLKNKVKQGVLLGRPMKDEINPMKLADKKDEIIYQYNLGVPLLRIAENFKVHRLTLTRAMLSWNIGNENKWFKKEKERSRQKAAAIKMMKYKDSDFKPMRVDRDKMIELINADLTLPQIAEKMPEYTYEQIYDTVLLDYEFNCLYRKKGMMKVKSGRAGQSVV